MSTPPPPAPEPYDPNARPDAGRPQYAPEPYPQDQRTSSSDARPHYAPPQDDVAARGAGSPTKRRRGLGLIAFLVALVGAVVGSILAGLGGAQTGALAQYIDVSGTTQPDPNSLPPEAQQAAIVGSTLVVAGFLVWGVLALWGLIQGIIAAVKDRGRGWGIAAIIIAVLGVGAVATAFGIGAAAGAAPYLNGM